MEEKLAILKMVEAGTITVEDAAKLLESLGEEKEEIISYEDKSEDNVGVAKWLRLRVKNANGKNKVKVNIPIALVDVGLKLGATYDKNMQSALKDIDLNAIIQAVKDGAEGKIVDIETDEGEIVEVVVE